MTRKKNWSHNQNDGQGTRWNDQQKPERGARRLTHKISVFSGFHFFFPTVYRRGRNDV